MQATAEALADLAKYESIIVDLPPLTSAISFRDGRTCWMQWSAWPHGARHQ